MENQKNTYALEGGFAGSLSLAYLANYSLALLRSKCRLLISCALANDSDSPWADAEVSLSCPLAQTASASASLVPAHASVDLARELAIEIDPAELVQADDPILTTITAKVAIDSAPALEREFPLALYPYGYWLGLGIRPETTASFVTPGAPALDVVKEDAARILERMTGTAALDNYATQDPGHARAQVAAVYEALRRQGVALASDCAPAYGEAQRVQSAERVLADRSGSPLEVACLAASCLESIGLNPLLVFTGDAVMAGAWLVRDSYPKPLGDDPEFLLKVSADGINEIALFNPACLAASDFDHAADSAIAAVSGATAFDCFIDIRQARVNGVRPLPARILADGAYALEQDGHADDDGQNLRQYDRYDLTEYAPDSKKVTKYTIWERKLLDFSLRNNLLNMRMGKKIIPLVSFSIDKLEDCLQAGETFYVEPFPLAEAAQPAETGMFDSSRYPTLQEYILTEMGHKRVHSWQRIEDLRESLKHVYRASRTSLEENGANNLYLVLGILKWYETDRSQQPRFAPVLLLPIEIVRRAGLTGYVIRTRDEDITLNITLAELLKQQHDVDLSGLEELPKDESGVDVKKIFAFIRDRIRSKRGWNVLDESLIGLFSFSKFVMWNDIHSNSDKLHQNEIISSLVDGKLNLANLDIDADAKLADLDNKPEDFTIPIDVDSSQLEAVIASGAGRSFILHGPPGTGKSQTITNMIANALYQGRRVLFVAEKMAALSVVQARLAKIGLAPFCLELHSNKVTKQHFLKQMDDALAVTRTQSPKDFHLDSEELYAKRRELIRYIEALHAKGDGDLSLYDCITSYLAIDGPELAIDIDKLPRLDARSIRDMREDIASLDIVFRLAGAPASSPLRGIDIIDGSAQAESGFASLLQQAADALADIMAMAQQYAPQIKIIGLPENDEALKWGVGFCNNVIRNLKQLPAECWRICLDERLCKKLQEACISGCTAAESWQKLIAKYGNGMARVNPEQYCNEWALIQSKWVLPRFFAKRSFTKRIAALYCPGFTEADAANAYSLLADIRDNSPVYSAMSGKLRQVFGSLADYGNEDWDELRLITSLLHTLAESCRKLADIVGIRPEEAAERLAQAHAAVWPFSQAERDKLAKTTRHIVEYFNCIGKLGKIAMIDLPSNASYDERLAAMRRWIGAKDKFRDWSAWCAKRQAMERDGLKPVADYILANGASAASAADAFAKSVYRQLARKMIDSDETLRFFNGAYFEQSIEKYRSITSRFQELSKRELFCRLASNIPSQSMAAHDTSEIGILKRNIKNGGRGTSIRKIIDQIPTLLPKLCPCMLMSPLSVAQYIDLDNEKFDIVIFDEASQMPTSEAVGAIARGKALIVVGDPKQMPPTSFFTTSAVGEEEANIDDMESILDDCISLSIPSKYLTWHYRSKHESLIAFSNSQYYDGKLFTFPSVDDQTTKVTLRPVQGVYDKGSTRSNVAEARAVVGEVMRRLRDPELRKLSIGIVSFSKVQQDKIEDMLMDELAKHPDLEAIALEGPEPIFVKNLENVQGDERDVILFSIGYGPDKNGKVSMNFGPLNNAGGERRLNVAVSRARHEMAVFSSLRSDQIDLKRTSSLGVEGLKRFLEYAESGRSPLIASQSAAAPDSVARQIAEKLAEKGYKANLSVGRSHFRVDIAVVDPEKPSEYLLGILCDGPSYYATKTVRDREVVQPNVLKALKWNVMRVWTLDWFERPDQVVASILARIAEIQAHVEMPSTYDSPQIDHYSEPAPETIANEETPGLPYVAADLPTMLPIETDGQLKYRAKELRKQLETLIQVEQPILATLIYRRIAKAWGIPRMTPRIQAVIDNELGKLLVYKEQTPEGAVYWQRRAERMGYDKFRNDSDRDCDEVPAIEIRNAMLYVIEQQVAMSRDSLKHLTAQILGMGRKRSRMDARVAPVLQVLLDEGLLTATGDTIKKR